MNPLLQTDSYKLTHHKQYPPKTEKVYSYLESRGGEHNSVVFFGLQYILQRYLTGRRIYPADIDEADEFARLHFGSDHFNREGWEYIVNEYKGRLPLRIKAVPEGTLVPVKNVLMTIENTDPNCFWLTNYVESMLLKVWYPTTVASRSYHLRRTMEDVARKTGDIKNVPFMLHDFGYRGVSSEESAQLGGAAHLLNFLGTDNLSAFHMLEYWYGKDWKNTKKLHGFSVPAAEHSTITSWDEENEVKAFENMLDQYPTGIVSVVSDSYDIMNAVNNLWGDKLKEKVLARDGVLVIRPDSGDPLRNLMHVLPALGKAFGTTENAKGYKVLNPKVRVIQGDGVNPNSIKEILMAMAGQGWSSDNLVFGMGGKLLQGVNRDTYRFAIKCSAIRRDGEWHDVYKTSEGKESKRGRLALAEVVSSTEEKGYTLRTVPEAELKAAQKEGGVEDVLRTVFLNGTLLEFDTFSEIKQRLHGEE